MGFEKFDLPYFEGEPVLGILRGIKLEKLDQIFEVIVDSGLKYIEITLNTPEAPKLIRTAVLKYGKSICIGAGTVLTSEDYNVSVESGAKFIVSPTLNENVADRCLLEKIPYFPGALTPTEVERCWQAGATMVKVFPASRFGPPYFKEIKAPFNNIKLMAVGGVGIDNMLDYLNFGASALAFGGSVFSVSRMDAGEYHQIAEDLKAFLLKINKYFDNDN